VTAPAPARLIERGKFGVSVWTSVLLDKFLYGRPSHRLLQDLAGRRQLSWPPGDNYPGRWRRGEFADGQSGLAVFSLVSFSTAVWQAKRVRP